MSRNYLLDYTAHWGGSDHVADGQQMDGKLEMFHYHIQYKDWAVLFVMIDPTEQNQKIQKIVEVFPLSKLKGQAAQTAEQVDLENILPKDKDYFTYLGSLLTPERKYSGWCWLSQSWCPSRQWTG